ncbi:hypothetical protein JCM10207_009262 [Rhodosporidiobolus poonsookiae]
MKLYSLAVATPCLTALASAAPVHLERRAGEITYDDWTADDSTGNIRYFPNDDPEHKWTHLVEQGTLTYNGTYSTLQYGGASYEFTFSGSGFEIWSAKKSNSGYFDVYRGDELLGTGDAYASCRDNFCRTPAEVLFSIIGVITVKNREADERFDEVPLLFLDKVVISE